MWNHKAAPIERVQTRVAHHALSDETGLDHGVPDLLKRAAGVRKELPLTDPQLALGLKRGHGAYFNLLNLKPKDPDGRQPA